MRKVIAFLLCAVMLITCGCNKRDDGSGKVVKEMAQELGKTFYTTSYEETSTLGDFNPSIVGIDEDAFKNEILYAFPEESEFETVINLGDLGFSEKNSGTDNVKIFNKAISSARKGSGLKKIIIPNGTYNLSDAIVITKAENYYICGCGSTSIIYDGTSTAFQFVNSENIHLSDVSITYSRHTWLKGTVLQYYPDTVNVRIQFEEDADLDYEGYTDVVRGYYTMCTVDGSDRDYINYCKPARYYVGDTVIAKNNEKKTATIHFNHEYSALNAVPEAGDEVTIVLDETSTPCLDAEYCKNVYLENVSVSNTFGMVFVSQWSENIYINRFTCVPSDGDLLSSHWDGIHTCFLRGDLVITNSRIEATQDDPINICTMYETAESLEGNKLTISTDILGVKVGDLLEFYDPSSWKLAGTAYVTERNGSVITLDREVSGVSQGFLVGDDNTATHLTIRNCLIGNCLGRCLIQTRSTVIEGNTFYRMRGCPIRCHSVSDIFHEGLVPKDMTIRNNKIISCNSTRDYNGAIEVCVYVYETGETTTGVVSGVTIENNYICDTPGIGVSLYGVTGACVKNNLFYNILSGEDNFPKDRLSYYNNLAGNMNSPAFHGSVVGLMFCDNVEISGNIAMADGLSAGNFIKKDAETVTNVTSSGNKTIK